MPMIPPVLGTSSSSGLEDFDILAINRYRSLALTNDNRVLPIVSFVDDEGDEVPSDDATYAVVQEDDNKFWRIKLASYDQHHEVH